MHRQRPLPTRQSRPTAAPEPNGDSSEPATAAPEPEADSSEPADRGTRAQAREAEAHPHIGAPIRPRGQRHLIGDLADQREPEPEPTVVGTIAMDAAAVV